MFYINFLHFVAALTITLACYPSPHPIQPHHIHLMEMGTYATYDKCNFTLIVPKKVINPYKKEIQNFVHQKPFGSLWLKCAACLAVAEEIASTIKNLVVNSEIEKNGQDFANEELSKQISSLCTSGFRNFDLRKYNESSLVTDNLKCTEHVNTKMDGNWTKKLREMCSLYISYMDLRNLGNEYSNSTEELANNLCSGSGVFRDCLNIELEEYKKVLNALEDCDDSFVYRDNSISNK